MLRDDKTTKALLDLLAKVKNKYPNMRLCQIIGDVFKGSGDNYYREDKELLTGLKRAYPEVK